MKCVAVKLALTFSWTVVVVTNSSLFKELLAGVAQSVLSGSERQEKHLKAHFGYTSHRLNFRGK